ncbi:MAG: hypothetical protein WCT23_08395, partial [Candidatus Neomarinimicrobiota bacterium]
MSITTISNLRRNRPLRPEPRNFGAYTFDAEVGGQGVLSLLGFALNNLFLHHVYAYYFLFNPARVVAFERNSTVYFCETPKGAEYIQGLCASTIQ